MPNWVLCARPVSYIFSFFHSVLCISHHFLPPPLQFSLFKFIDHTLDFSFPNILIYKVISVHLDASHAGRHYQALPQMTAFFFFFWAVVKLFFPMKRKLCFITFICCPPCICSLESHGIHSVPGLPSENWTQWITSFELLICAKVPGSFTHFSCTMVSPISTLHLVFLYLPWRVKIPLRINRGREYSVHLKITITISNDNSWNWSWHMETDVLTWVVQCDLFYYSCIYHIYVYWARKVHKIKHSYCPPVFPSLEGRGGMKAVTK